MAGARHPGFAVPGQRRPIACQSWLWEMQGDQWSGRVEDILDAAADAGLAGVELTMNTLARRQYRPESLKAALADRGLQLACLRYSMPTGFTVPADAAAELAGSREAIRYALAAGTQRLGLKGPSNPEPQTDRAAKADQAYRMCDEVGRVASEGGLTINVHLHSHPDAVVRTPDEWARFLDHTDPTTVFACADAGHLLRSGHDPAQTVRRHISRISHVHLKDAGADGSFPPLGAGVLDVSAFVQALTTGGYEGWVVLEEEDESQVANPAEALRTAAEIVRRAGW